MKFQRNNPYEYASIFDKNPKKTIFFFSVAVFLIIDLGAAAVYRLVNDRPYGPAQAFKEYHRRKALQQQARVGNSIFHHTLRQNVSLDEVYWGSLRYTMYTNSLGFRDRTVREVPLEAKKPRILFLGDSFVEGLGVDYEDSFVGIIHQELQKANLSVLNMGVISYSPYIYHDKIKYYLEEKGLKVDYVVVYLDISDIHDEYRRFKGEAAREGPNPKLKVGNAKAPPMASSVSEEKGMDGQVGKESTQEYSHGTKQRSSLHRLVRAFKNTIQNHTLFTYFVTNGAYQYLKVVLQSQSSQSLLTGQKKTMKRINRKRSMWTIDNKIYEEYGKAGLFFAEKNMTRLHELLKKHHVDMFLAVYPWPDQIINHDLDSIQVTFWQRWGAAHGVPVINYFPHFIMAEVDPEATLGRLFIPGDVHWTKEGNRLVARIFLDYFRTEVQNTAEHVNKTQRH